MNDAVSKEKVMSNEIGIPDTAESIDDREVETQSIQGDTFSIMVTEATCKTSTLSKYQVNLLNYLILSNLLMTGWERDKPSRTECSPEKKPAERL